MEQITVKEIITQNNLEIIEEGDQARRVETDRILRPGLELSGFLEFYDPQRVILVGTKEYSYLKTLAKEEELKRLEALLHQKPPLIVFSKNTEPDQNFIELAQKYKITIAKSKLRTQATNAKLYSFLQEILAKKISIHGVLLDIYGLGTLIIGESGVGKSETALDLIQRGHQLIADDLVEVFEKEPGNLIGSAPDIIKQYMEIRGIGVVNVVHMFGSSSYRPKKSVKLVIELEQWQKDKYYDRLGLIDEKVRYFDTDLKKIVIPVQAGRNVALLVEAAVRSEKLKIYSGYNDAKRFCEAIDQKTKGE